MTKLQQPFLAALGIAGLVGFAVLSFWATPLHIGGMSGGHVHCIDTAGKPQDVLLGEWFAWEKDGDAETICSRHDMEPHYYAHFH